MERTSKKRSRSQKYYSNTFKTKEVKKLCANRFKQRAVLAEQGVTCADFTGEFADKRGLRGSKYSARRPCLKGAQFLPKSHILCLLTVPNAVLPLVLTPLPARSLVGRPFSAGQEHVLGSPISLEAALSSYVRSQNPYVANLDLGGIPSLTLSPVMWERIKLVKKSLGRSASRDTSSHSPKSKEKGPMLDEWSFQGKGKLGDGDISMGPSSNMPKEVQKIAKARTNLTHVNSDHIPLSSTLRSTCTSAHPRFHSMKLLNELFHESSIDTYFEAISAFLASEQVQWDFLRMSDDHRRSWLSQLLP